jgi:hypothetical protein
MPELMWSANELRALAEAADALRNEVGWVVEIRDQETGEQALAVVTPDEAVAQGITAPILKLITRDNPELGTLRAKISVLTSQKVLVDDKIMVSLDDFDAIFTSLSAVEKFVIPYYARHHTLDYCEKIRIRFAQDASIVAVLHVPPSKPTFASKKPGFYFGTVPEGDRHGPIRLGAI